MFKRGIDMLASDTKIVWHRCRVCGVFSDADEKFCCGDHHEGPFEVVSLSPREILADPALRQKVRTKDHRPFYLGPDS